MKKNTLLRAFSCLATGTLVFALTGFSVNTYACDACNKARKSEAVATANEKTTEAAPAPCTDGCKCKEGESNASGTCHKD